MLFASARRTRWISRSFNWLWILPVRGWTFEIANPMPAREIR
jgi:hypothetical protein